MAKHTRWKVGERGPRPVDAHVGSRVRIRRTMLGMNQAKLGESVGLTFQQMQKYERGMNRIGASRLYALSGVLGVPVSYFFEGLDDARSKSGEDTLTKRETHKLRHQQQAVHASIVRDRIDGGVFTPKERAKAQVRLNQQSRRIYRQKHDNQTR